MVSGTKKSRVKKLPKSSDVDAKRRVEKPAQGPFLKIPLLPDVNSRGADLDSAPPTPKWSDDIEESGDRSIPANNRVSDEKMELIVQVPSDAQRESIGNETPSSEPRTAEAPVSEKKVFGFSLLDIQPNDPKSPTSPIGKVKDFGNVMSPPPRTATVPPLKLESRIDPEKCR